MLRVRCFRRSSAIQGTPNCRVVLTSLLVRARLPHTHELRDPAPRGPCRSGPPLPSRRPAPVPRSACTVRVSRSVPGTEACRRCSSGGRAGHRVRAGKRRPGRGRAMLGKDYMLAIILVNCDDDLWGDQSLEGETGLPPGWRKIRDAAGTYYWHVPSGSTQWQRPTWELGGAEDPGAGTEGIWELRPPKGRSFSTLDSSLNRSNSVNWYGEDSYVQNLEPGAKCFAVRSLGWVEVPEEDLAPGKSSIAVNNCIQQLAQTRNRSQPSDGAWGEGQNMLMILKKDAMCLVNPLDHSMIHCQPLVHIRVWGVGSSKGRDFAFVAGDKDSCMLKCHVFHCDVPAKAIASALQGLCAQILSERGVSGDAACCSPDPISPEDLPRQVELLDAVSQAAQRYEALYMGILPVTKAMGMDVLNEAIGTLTARRDRNTWVPAMLSVSDSLMTAHSIQAEAGAEEEPLWQCPVRLVTFIGVGRDPHTFGLIADLGCQSFQCAAFWCQPHAGGLSEAVQAACMVQYQKCLVASAARGKAWGAQARARLRLKRTSSMDSPGGPLPLPLLKGGVGGAGAAPRKRGVFSFLDAFRLKPSLLHMS
ncbi:amyloid-beta A4 precursor protein-binding family B member 3 isoform X2 [Nannospalax galili]|uniref:amyloid-beta A4 precursor protein-binding family B member 3 isoform X2 n=1 Tax=Nannospalax galili TaxID=1026970 RepID=UPI0004ED308E|nr:amyloid-beta A4 precursor protein-binding family B member 3 isoform X2 [Nannospalax galili]